VPNAILPLSSWSLSQSLSESVSKAAIDLIDSDSDSDVAFELKRECKKNGYSASHANR